MRLSKWTVKPQSTAENSPKITNMELNGNSNLTGTCTMYITGNRHFCLQVQSERFFTQGLFLRPSCHPDEFQAEFLQRIISPPLE